MFFSLIPMYLYSCRMSRKVPETVQITGKELKILKIDENVNTTFVCEVNNRIGSGKNQVAAFVRGERHDTNRRTCSSLQIRNSCINVSREIFTLTNNRNMCALVRNNRLECHLYTLPCNIMNWQRRFPRLLLLN